MNLQSGCNTGQGPRHSPHKPDIHLQIPPSDHGDPRHQTLLLSQGHVTPTPSLLGSSSQPALCTR